MNDQEDPIRIEVCADKGTTKSRVTASWRDAVVHEDRFDLSSATARLRFAQNVAERAGDPDAAYEVEALLLGKVEELRQPPPAISPIDWGTQALTRPQIFIRPDVVGLCVPTIYVEDEKPAGKWMLCRRWRDGRRDIVPLPSFLELPDGGRLWLLPQPNTPDPHHIASPWSEESQRAWVAGSPAPDPFDLFDRLRDAFSDFLFIPQEDEQGATATLALWVILTYAFQAWDAVPYLSIGGPAGSGKSTVFQLLDRLAYRPLMASSITASAIFRRLDDRGGTLLLDEAERLKEGSPDMGEIRAILLSGYKRGATATRNERAGDGQFRQVDYSCFGPKALACINNLPPALASRCITLIMTRCGPESDKPRRRIDEDSARWSKLRDDLHQFVLEYGGELIDAARRADVCPSMSGRNYELWQPLMALASWLESRGATGLLTVIHAHAAKVIALHADDQVPDTDETILRLLADAVKGFETPTPGELLAKSREAEPETFRMWTARSVSNVLKRYKIVAHKSNGIRRYSGVTINDLARVQRAYSIDLGITPGSENSPALPPAA